MRNARQLLLLPRVSVGQNFGREARATRALADEHGLRYLHADGRYLTGALPVVHVQLEAPSADVSRMVEFCRLAFTPVAGKVAVSVRDGKVPVRAIPAVYFPDVMVITSAIAVGLIPLSE